jgi:hypothetical protein
MTIETTSVVMGMGDGDGRSGHVGSPATITIPITNPAVRDLSGAEEQDTTPRLAPGAGRVESP